MFHLASKYKPAGDQPKAIEFLCNGLSKNIQNQTLLGVTGSGKTFTMANVIYQSQRPALIMAHNKTLAAQLYFEMKEFFPENAVEYFVSYYDYYQPEAYVPRTDTYIPKDASINERIDLLRHSATRSLLQRKDVIVVSSVSCIYGLGSPDLYGSMILKLESGRFYTRDKIISSLVKLQYERNDTNFDRGKFRVRGQNIDVFPSHYADKVWRIRFEQNCIEIFELDAITMEKIARLDFAVIFAKSHYVTPKEIIENAIKEIEQELEVRVKYFKDLGKEIEAQRVKERTEMDIEMLWATGFCKGIENYSRYISGQKEGEPPPTLFSYLPKNAILFIDESHVTLPQIAAMYNGDNARKSNLVNYGFRLPSALDNRPLKFEEWELKRPQTIFVSATPSTFEIDKGNIVEQIIRPTGLIDPECIIKSSENQIHDLTFEIRKVVANDLRVLVTTLTKKMSEDLAKYLADSGIKVSYIHSDISTLDRINIIKDLRIGKFDVLVGINLLREGLDIPECGLVAILDADKEGFLRSETSLIQTIGRASRNDKSYVILYADQITKSMHNAISETNRRREIQSLHNKDNGIIPRAVYKKQKYSAAEIEEMKQEMLIAAENLDFEKAALLRDKIINA